jgi:subtilisin-like proprotein convertase family protein
LSAAVAVSIGATVAELAATSAPGQLRFGCNDLGFNCTRSIPELGDDTPGPLLVSLEVPEGACDKAASVGVEIQIDHSWVGDLRVELLQTNSSIVLLDRPGVPAIGKFGCPGVDIDVTIDDSVAGDERADDECAITIPAIAGTKAASATGLSALAGAPCAGTWALAVEDLAAPNSGTLVDWALLIQPEDTATPTATDSATPASTATATQTISHTPTKSPTESPPATPTATAEGTGTSVVGTPTDTPTEGAITSTPAPGTPTDTPSDETPTVAAPTETPATTCVGDCDGDGAVSISELIRGVNIALELASLEQCPAFDRNGNGAVEISELIAAVNNALDGCP